MGDGGAVQARTLNVLDSAGASEWDEFVHRHPDRSAFHEAAWAGAIHETYGHKPIYQLFTIADEPIALVPLIEILSPLTGRRAVCLPFSDACGPLLFERGRSESVKNGLANLARQRAWKYCEIRGGDLFDESAEPLMTFYGHRLQLLSDPDAVFERLGNGTKGAVRQAIKSGGVAEISRDEAAVKEFYSLQVQTRRKHGVPPQPFAFFANVHKKMIAKGLGFTVLARDEGRIVAGAIFLQNEKRAIYKFAASNADVAKTRGNNLVLWEAIQHLIRKGCEELDFGRTSPDQEGLRRFKLSWGAEEEMIRYNQFDVTGDRWATAIRRDRQGIQNRIFRTLPLAVNRLAGAMLYPHLD